MRHLPWRIQEHRLVNNPRTARDKYYEFESLVGIALKRIFDADSVLRNERLPGPTEADFVVRLKGGGIAIVEVKLVTPATLTRLDHAAAQLRSLGAAYASAAERGAPAPVLALAVSEALAPEHKDHLKSLGVDRVIDGPLLRQSEPDLPWPEPFSAGRPRESAAVEAVRRSTDALDAIPAGRPDWARYQRTVTEILTSTLCPPLEQPLAEHPSLSGANRRDMIFPNYANAGTWKFLRDHYEAHYVVVDAKNYAGQVKKAAILQIANYLSAHGAGLFGMIVCRSAADRSAEFTRREHWMVQRKLIIVLNDDDLKQMAEFAANHSDPATVIRQKIEDFRLGF